MSKQIVGKNITSIRTQGTMYDTQCVVMYTKGDTFYKMKVEELFKFTVPFREVVFNVVKKRVYNYLEVKE